MNKIDYKKAQIVHDTLRELQSETCDYVELIDLNLVYEFMKKSKMMIDNIESAILEEIYNPKSTRKN